MFMYDLYSNWGFSENPFNTNSLPANERGWRLLVGRDEQMDLFLRRLYSPPKFPTIEGPNGIGKTSLVNVGSFTATRNHLETGEGPLFVLCEQPFQLGLDTSPEEFVDQVYYEVAQTLFQKAKEFEGARFEAARESGALRAWLNSPHLTSIQGSLLNIGGGLTKETNTSFGFGRSGLRHAVQALLDDAFPTEREGGVICVIDNLELLQTSEQARRTLEQLRDILFSIRGLRWVLCGALGIVHGVADSPRLDGKFHSPVEVGDLGAEAAPAVLESRVRAYARENVECSLPITPEDFQELFRILRGNLRSVLSNADNYCQWVGDRIKPSELRASDVASRRKWFADWLSEVCEKYLRDVSENLRPRAWEVFETALELGGAFSPSDHELFGANSMQTLRPHVRDLEVVGMLRSVTDESDKRRKTIVVQPKGWLVAYARRRRQGT